MINDATAHETALIVDQFGAYVSKYSERLRVSVKKETVAEIPLLYLEQVLVAGRGVSVSSDAIEACCERGIPVYFLSGRGEPYAAMYAAGLGGTILTRRAQLAAYDDARGMTVACAITEGKITNQANLLRYIAKYRRDADPEAHQTLRRIADEVRDLVTEVNALRRDPGLGALDDLRPKLLSIEGRAAQHLSHGGGEGCPR